MYSSALEEDLGKAQAHMDLLLNGEGAVSSKQNEILKAAAKQVTPLHILILGYTFTCTINAVIQVESCLLF